MGHQGGRLLRFWQTGGGARYCERAESALSVAHWRLGRLLVGAYSLVGERDTCDACGSSGVGAGGR